MKYEYLDSLVIGGIALAHLVAVAQLLQWF